MVHTSPTAYELLQLGIKFPGAQRPVLDNFSMTVPRGQFLSLVGPSGCGKSTLLKLLAGLLSPTSGSLTCDAMSEDGADRIGFVFQHPTLLPWRTAEANLQLPMELGKARKRHRLSAIECAELLQQVGLMPGDAKKRPAQLSGGMQMRLSLARALATQPAVLLLDEPFAAVDDLLRLRLQEDVRRLHNERELTTILVTHNLHEAVFLSDRVLVLNGPPSRVQSEVFVSGPTQRYGAFRETSEFYTSLKAVSTALFRRPENAGDVIP